MEAPKGRNAYFETTASPPLIGVTPSSVPQDHPMPSAPLSPELSPLPNPDSGAINVNRMQHNEFEHFFGVPSEPVLFDKETMSKDDEMLVPTEVAGPEILLEPLHILDPLCIKWGFGIGVVRKGAQSEALLPQSLPRQRTSVPVFLDSPASYVPTSSEPRAGYLRLMGLLPDGHPWECTLPFSGSGHSDGTVIGRDPSCSQVVLNEDSVSRRHVLLEYIDNRPVVTDLGSTNGTFINGHRLAPTERRVPVEDGFILMLGDILLRAELLQPSPNFRPM